MTGIPVKTIRSLMTAGHLRPRLRNRMQNPRQPKYLVNVDEVAAAAERLARERLAGAASRTGADATIDLEERARQVRGRSARR